MKPQLGQINVGLVGRLERGVRADQVLIPTLRRGPYSRVCGSESYLHKKRKGDRPPTNASADSDLWCQGRTMSLGPEKMHTGENYAPKERVMKLNAATEILWRRGSVAWGLSCCTEGLGNSLLQIKGQESQDRGPITHRLPEWSHQGIEICRPLDRFSSQNVQLQSHRLAIHAILEKHLYLPCNP